MSDIEKLTFEEQIKLLTDEEITGIAAEGVRRVRESSRWACRDCGLTMDYVYVMGDADTASKFDKDGCPGCGGIHAIALREAASS